MWSDYRGGKAASEMGPPANLPSETIRPKAVSIRTLTCPLCTGDGCRYCQPDSHISEPGFWSVVINGANQQYLIRRPATIGPQWQALGSDDWWEWDELINPVVVARHIP